jgi:Autographiviridae endonuclease
MHYRRWAIFGDPHHVLKRVPPVGSQRQWVEDNVLSGRSREDGCWEDWPYRIVNGYPKYNKKHVSQLVLAVDGRPQPPAPKNQAQHHCDNRLCINPEHLYWGTQQWNMLDKLERTGVTGKQKKLTDEQVLEIYLSLEPKEELARRYDIDAKSVYNIEAGIRFARVTEDYWPLGLTPKRMRFVGVNPEWVKAVSISALVASAKSESRLPWEVSQ